MRARLFAFPLLLSPLLGACNSAPMESNNMPANSAQGDDAPMEQTDPTPKPSSPSDIQRSDEDFGRIVEPPHDSPGDRVAPPSDDPTMSHADDLSAPELVPEAAKGEKGARNVLLEWGAALEQKDFARAYAQWGNAGARSGMTEREFAAFYAKFATITVAMPSGRLEGATGSLYYTAPTTITGKLESGEAYRLEGPVILRRTNNVPGASAQALRWHIESADLKPRAA